MFPNTDQAAGFPSLISPDALFALGGHHGRMFSKAPAGSFP